MAGTYFDYQPGRMEAKFSHDEKFDYVTLGVRLVGDITTATACDDRGTFADPVDLPVGPRRILGIFLVGILPVLGFPQVPGSGHRRPGVRFRMGRRGPVRKNEMAPTVRQRYWLPDDGVAIGGKPLQPPHDAEHPASGQNTIRILPRFVDSEDYDPLRYEELSNGEGFQLVIADASLDDLAQALTPLDSQSVHSAIARLWDTAAARSTQGPKASFPLSHYFERGWSELPLSEWDSWIPDDWDALDQSRRAGAVRELFGWGRFGWYGAHLRELRSVTVEAWLAEPEPPPRRSYRIPVKSGGETRDSEGPSSDGSP